MASGSRLFPARYANVTEGQPCILDQTTYYESGSDGTQFANVITRSNCKTPKFYCDAGRATCQRTRPIGSPCASDFECEQVRNKNSGIASPIDAPAVLLSQQHCSIDGLCAQARDKAARVATWHYAITAFFIVASTSACAPFLCSSHFQVKSSYDRHLHFAHARPQASQTAALQGAARVLYRAIEVCALPILAPSIPLSTRGCSLRQTIIALHSAACPPVAEKPRRMGSASRTSSYYAHL